MLNDATPAGLFVMEFQWLVIRQVVWSGAAGINILYLKNKNQCRFTINNINHNLQDRQELFFQKG